MKRKTTLALLMTVLVATSVVATQASAAPMGAPGQNRHCHCMKKKRMPAPHKQFVKPGPGQHKPNPLQFNPHGWDG